MDFSKITTDEVNAVQSIVNRYCRSVGMVGADKLDLYMDLHAANADVGLDFAKLETAPDADFFHDVSGIRRHMDRTTGKLGDCFLPRCALHA